MADMAIVRYCVVQYSTEYLGSTPINTELPVRTDTWFHGTKPHTAQSPKQKSPVQAAHASKERFIAMEVKRGSIL